MARFLKAFARPWELPPFAFILLLGLNRLIYREALKLESPLMLTPVNMARYFSRECLNAFFIALLLASSIFIVLKLTKSISDVSFSELLSLTLKSQSFYLLSAPVALVFLSLSGHLYESLIADIAKFLKAALPLTIFATLFFLLKNRLQNFNEIRILSLVFAPYLLFIGILLSVVVTIASLVVVVATFAILR